MGPTCAQRARSSFSMALHPTEPRLRPRRTPASFGNPYPRRSRPVTSGRLDSAVPQAEKSRAPSQKRRPPSKRAPEPSGPAPKTQASGVRPLGKVWYASPCACMSRSRRKGSACGFVASSAYSHPASRRSATRCSWPSTPPGCGAACFRSFLWSSKRRRSCFGSSSRNPSCSRQATSPA